MDNFTYERGVVQRNNMFSALIEDDNIYQISGWNTQKILLGVSMKKYNELKEVADGYYNVLIDKGIIEKPKTPEQIAEEQKAFMNSMFEQIKMLNNEIKTLKKNNEVEIETTNEVLSDDKKTIKNEVKKNK